MPKLLLCSVRESAFYPRKYDNEIKFFSNGNDGINDG